MMKVKTKISILLTICLMASLMVFSAPKASAITDLADAPGDWAFDASSVELNDAIAAEYPGLADINGFITEPAANAMTGPLDVNTKGIGGTMKGIEHFKLVDSINLSNNQLREIIPSGIGELTNLTEFRVDQNFITGDIPITISNLNKLERLNLSNNKLSGSIPSNIGNLTNLEFLGLSSNELSGNIPSSIGSLADLEELQLYMNQLEGEIPSTIGGLSKLRILRIFENKLEGEIPSTIGSLTSLENLNLSTNKLSGAIPTSIVDLPNLGELYLHVNELNGEIPSNIGNLSDSLHTMDVSQNRLIGEIPSTMGDLTLLGKLGLRANKLTGEIPASIASLPGLNELYLDNNQFTSVPQSIFDLLTGTQLNVKDSSIQRYSKSLSQEANLDEDFTFAGLPIYEQLPSYGVTLYYALDCPDGSEKIVIPTIFGGMMTISGSDLDQIGEYSLRVMTSENADIFPASKYITTFGVGESIDYLSASVNGQKNKAKSTKIIIDLAKVPSVGELSIDDITLAPKTRAATDVKKDSLVNRGGGAYELSISGQWEEGTAINVVLEKTGATFLPDAHEVTLHAKVDNNGGGGNSNGGDADGNNVGGKVKPATAKTGDDTNLYMTMFIAFVSIILMTGVFVKRRKQ